MIDYIRRTVMLLLNRESQSKPWVEEIRLSNERADQIKKLEKRLDELMEPKSFWELKEYLKLSANEIRNIKKKIRAIYDAPLAEDRNWRDSVEFHISTRASMAKKHRLYHLAYCLLKGRHGQWQASKEQIIEWCEPMTRNKLGSFELKLIDDIVERCSAKEVANVN